MATLTTKFSIGDTVWYANTTTETCQHRCPDCSGSRKWEATSPAGGVYAIPCPRCSVQYQSNDELRLNYTQCIGTVRKLTIGQIKATSGPEPETEYMCSETGIGSGNVYREGRLFHTEAEAMACADAMAGAANVDQSGWVAIQYNKSLTYSDYQFSDAQLNAAISKVRSARYRVEFLVEDLINAETMSEVKSAVEAWQGRDDAEWVEFLVAHEAAKATPSDTHEVG